MSMIGYFNKPKLTMYDIDDYVSGGFIGLPINSAASVPLKDLPWNGESNTGWDNAASTFRATRDIFISKVNRYILESLTSFSDLYYQRDLRKCDEIDVKWFPINTKEVNDFNRLLEAADNVFYKYFDFFINSNIFWNQFQKQDKRSGTINLELNLPLYSQWLPKKQTVNFSREINFDNYPKLTSEIYENYINSLKEFMYAIKIFIKMATNSDFEEVTLPVDFTVPYIPPIGT